MERTIDQSLPHSPHAEKVILGGIILYPQHLNELSLTVEDFYLPTSRAIYQAMVTLANDGREINPILVSEQLKRDGKLELVGGILALVALTDGLPNTSSLSPYEALVRELAQRRRLIYLCNELIRDAMESDVPTSGLLEHAEISVSSLVRFSGISKTTTASFDEKIGGQIERYEKFFRGISDAIPTGFPEIDEHLTGGGMIPKQLIVLAARPSVGKTSLGLDITANAAADGRRVLFFSLEMGTSQLLDRIVAYEAGVDRRKIRPGMYESTYLAILDALPRVSSLPVFANDSVTAMSRIRAHGLELSRRPETRPELIVVDYLQRVHGNYTRGSRNDAVGSVSRGLKDLAMELNVPVLALSQLNRDVERASREPDLADLRDSGEIESDADVVFFLFGAKAEEGAEFYERTLKCSKQRDGALFRTELIFNGPLVSFRKGRKVA